VYKRRQLSNVYNSSRTLCGVAEGVLESMWTSLRRTARESAIKSPRHPHNDLSARPPASRRTPRRVQTISSSPEAFTNELHYNSETNSYVKRNVRSTGYHPRRTPSSAGKSLRPTHSESSPKQSPRSTIPKRNTKPVRNVKVKSTVSSRNASGDTEVKTAKRKPTATREKKPTKAVTTKIPKKPLSGRRLPVV